MTDALLTAALGSQAYVVESIQARPVMNRLHVLVTLDRGPSVTLSIARDRVEDVIAALQKGLAQ